ncbi:MAG TPA: TIGR03790 family protein [Steroidobacteraceae bacterium]|nr:TIGR03790 family protein [Steroidobacteraceae bacterium]
MLPALLFALHLGASDLAVIVNTTDPVSVATAEYYVAKRHIPKSNVVRVQFDSSRDDLPPAQFSVLRANIERRLSSHVQAYALTWARPYRVGCMSITAAFAFGVDPRFCAAGCALTWPNPLFNSGAPRPYDTLRVRPAMSIAAVDVEQARSLIDRGVSSDRTQPAGTAYLVVTGDKARNVRAGEYFGAVPVGRPGLDVEIRHVALTNRADVLFYFIGAAEVPDLGTNRFLPGAIADHLTSFGGMLTDSPQMSSLRWLEAGATGSYGAVVEPCNYPSKFPDIPVLLRHYLAGETLIEAYWKSVLMPGQGLFIGEPLAAPFARPARSTRSR